MFHLNKGLMIAGAAALAFSAWVGGASTANASGQPFCTSNGSGPFYNQSLCAYAWQSVAAGGGNLPTSGDYVNVPAGPTYTTPSVTGPGSFYISFSVPTGSGGGYTFVDTTAVEAFTSGSCASSVPLSPTPTLTSSTTITFTVFVPAGNSGPCTVELGPTEIAGATLLAAPNYNCLTRPNSIPYFGCANTPPNELLICEDVFNQSGLGTVIDQANSPCALTALYAVSSSQLGFSTNPAQPLIVNIGAVDAEKLCLGTGWYQIGYDESNYVDNDPSFQNPCNPVADIGSLDIWTNDYGSSDSESIYTITPDTATVQIYGNYAGIATAYLAAGNSCGSGASAPSGAIVGTISGNTASFNLSSLPPTDTYAYYEFCLVSAGAGSGTGPVIGANFNGFGGPALPPGSTPPGGNSSTGFSNTSSPLITVATSPTQTIQNAVANNLQAYGYNGILQPINSSWANSATGLTSYIRVVNNTAEPIQVFADVQGDYGSLGTTTVENSLPGNTNDYVAVSTIVANAGVTPGPNGHLSIVLVIPYPAVASPPESGGNNTVVTGTGAQGACTPNTVSNANGTGGSFDGLCFVGISQLVSEDGGAVWVNLE